MATLPQEVRDMIDQVATVVLATSSSDGMPNCVPVGMKKVLDDHTVMVSDQFFNKTLADLQANPRAALTVWKDGKGYQIKGAVSYENSGDRFETLAAEVNAKFNAAGMPVRSKGVCIIDVAEVYYVTPGPDAGKSAI